MRRWWWAVSFALAPSACILGTDGLTGGGTSPSSGDAGDAATSADTDANANDASSKDAFVATDANPAACGETSICDDFDRTTALVDGGPWAIDPCDAVGTLTVNGTLVTTYPSSTNDKAVCLLETPLTSWKNAHFTLAFDMTFTPGTENDPFGVLAASLNMQLGPDASFANAAGQLVEGFQLSIDRNGRGELGAYFFYPDISKSPNPATNYPFYRYAAADSWVALATPCHIALEIDALTPKILDATATCGAKVVSMTPETPASPPGFAAPLLLDLGYAHTVSGASPTTKLEFDNLVFHRLE